MRSKIKQLADLATLVVVVLSVLGVAKYLNIQPKHIASCLANSATQLCTYLNNNEFLLTIEKICAAALTLLLIILRASMLRKVT
jgi:hypothetical protein